MRQLTCPQCGAQYSDEHEFCSKDGARLRPKEQETGAGRVLDGRFRLETPVGRGASGTVWRARQLSVDRAVAVKVMHGEGGTDPEKRRRFENEARALSRLRHPNSLALIDAGHTEEGQPFIVSPLLEGASLDQVLSEAPLAAERVQRILVQVCEALEEAHGVGLVHRDLKPENIFLEQHGEREVARVIDYGIALALDDERLTEEGKTIGTIAYMSPEQLRGDALDARSDLYSLGVIAYECLTGHRPFRSASRSSVVLMHLQEEPEPLDEVLPELPGRLVDVVMSALEKLPEHRPESARAFRRALGAPTTTEAPIATRADDPPVESGGGALWTSLVGLGVGLGLALVLLGRGEEAPEPPSTTPRLTDLAPMHDASIQAVDAAPKRPDRATPQPVEPPLDAAPPEATPPPQTRPAPRHTKPQPERTRDAAMPPPGLY